MADEIKASSRSAVRGPRDLLEGFRFEKNIYLLLYFNFFIPLIIFLQIILKTAVHNMSL